MSRLVLLKERLVYSLIRLATLPFQWMPYPWIHAVGRVLGIMGYYLLREYRKRSLSNIALATGLSFNRREIIRTAKQSFQNLAINCLEYSKLSREKNMRRVIRCENPEQAEELHAKGQGIIFFCGHQSNWEVLFLDGTSRMKGIAIGKSIKNKYLYRWIVSIREKQGGKIIAPRNAVREGMRALKKGVFIGIVGDQGMPNSGYCFPFLGRRAWTSTAPALLAYRTQCPIIFAETRRIAGGYRIRYHDPIWPDLSKPMEQEVVRMMDQTLTLFEESVRQSPGEWLWQHNRWKQQTPQNLYKRFRHDCVCIILPPKPEQLGTIVPHLPTLKSIYPSDFLFLIAPERLRQTPLIEADEIIYYSQIEETLIDDFRFKLIFDFTDYKPIRAHYEKLSVFEVINLKTLKALAKPHLPNEELHNLSEVFKHALCRPGSLWTAKGDSHAG